MFESGTLSLESVRKAIVVRSNEELIRFKTVVRLSKAKINQWNFANKDTGNKKVNPN